MKVLCVCDHENIEHDHRKQCLHPRCSCTAFIMAHKHFHYQHKNIGKKGRVYSKEQLLKPEWLKKYYEEV